MASATTPVQESAQEREQAQQQVERFVRRFEPSYRLLAYHAALPLVLTPELLNYLRNQFLRGEGVPWVAEVDLLLSDLCRPVGYEQYAMDTVVRAYLLEEMEQRLGKARVEAVARLLMSYVQQLDRINPYISQHELRSQQWAAMVYLDDRRVAREMAAAYRDCLAPGVEGRGLSQVNQIEMARLSRITQELAPQLRNHMVLLDYARWVCQLWTDPTQVGAEVFDRSFQVEDIELRLPTESLPEEHSVRRGTDPNILTFEFDVATIVLRTRSATAFESLPNPFQAPGIDLQPFEFEVATIALQPVGEWHDPKGESNLIVHRQQQQGWQFIEDLGTGELELVAIQGGSFLMGSSEDELERFFDEGPQHTVTVRSFLMGKYPVTQAHWRAVAAMPQVRRKLKPNPSRFKGENCPAARVSWYEAVEFCDRLSQYTGKEYRLPTEAEWEYACRAGMTTPFHFGEAITTALANYRGTDNKEYKWSGSYGQGPKGVYWEETTEVGSFPANAFGLYDMHGNVWERCLDHWHDNYEGAPIDGSAWLTKNEKASRLLRGGSWSYVPRYCRSACRYKGIPDDRGNDIGFRVVCSSAWTLA